MEDLTKKYKHPCIMDVKIGPITYDMHADAEKIKREESKFPFLEKVGFQLVGFKVSQGIFMVLLKSWAAHLYFRFTILIQNSTLSETGNTFGHLTSIPS